jgi:hypothetical protein
VPRCPVIPATECRRPSDHGGSSDGRRFGVAAGSRRGHGETDRATTTLLGR